MKFAVGVLVIFWLICGVAAAWRLDELDFDHWKTIAGGPITLADAFNEEPPSYPVR